jgi:hypothetical protein
MPMMKPMMTPMIKVMMDTMSSQDAKADLVEWIFCLVEHVFDQLSKVECLFYAKSLCMSIFIY